MRFAHEHVPSSPSRWFLIAVAGIFLALALPVVVLNLIADSLDARLIPHLPAYRKKVFLRRDIILWSAAEISRIPRAVLNRVMSVMAGDSRIDTLTSWVRNGRVVKIGDDYLLNLGVGSSSFDETMQMLEAELPHLPRLRDVVIGAPIERFGTPGAASRVPEARRMFDFSQRYLLNLRTFAWSIELLQSQAAMKWKSRRLAGPDIDAIQRRYVEMMAPLGVSKDFTVGAKDGIEPRFRDVSLLFQSTAKVLRGDICLRNFASQSSPHDEPSL